MDKMVFADKISYDYKAYDENGELKGTVRALDGVSLDVKHGDFITILGANGSGKSTLAKQINALLCPTEGTILVDGKDTADEENLLEIRQSAGMVFQNPDNQIIATVVEEEFRGSDKGNLGTCGGKLEDGRNVRIPQVFADASFRRTEAACFDCRCSGHASEVHHSR